MHTKQAHASICLSVCVLYCFGSENIVMEIGMNIVKTIKYRVASFMRDMLIVYPFT